MAKTVLVADDAGFMRQIISKTLEDGGYTVVAEAANGEEAIKLAIQWIPNIVIIDLVMPRLNGLQAISTILEEIPKAVFLICTSVDEMGFLEGALEHPQIHYLKKPFTQKELLQTLSDIFDNKKEKIYA